jgi:polyisoprenyl-phosphate glycosyltransferase
MNEQPLLSVVTPVYNEEEVLAEFYSRTKAVLQKLADECDHEIIFVNDGSMDRSLEILRGLADADPNVAVISFSRNFGHQSAITAGLDHASGDAVVIIDADLQDPPEVIAEMVAKWREGYKMVYGVRSHRSGEGRFKLWTAKVFYRVLRRLSDTQLPLDAGDFRLIDRQAVDIVKTMRERTRYMRGLLCWIGFSQCGVSYRRDPRFAGKTKYRLGAMLRFAMDGITNFSEKPLYAAGYFGLLVTLLALVMILRTFVNKLIHPEASVAGWTSLLLATLFLGGVQLLSLGLLGQYIGRIFRETKGRPIYVVAETRGLAGDRRKAAGLEPPSFLEDRVE